MEEDDQESFEMIFANLVVYSVKLNIDNTVLKAGIKLLAQLNPKVEVAVGKVIDKSRDSEFVDTLQELFPHLSQKWTDAILSQMKKEPLP